MALSIDSSTLMQLQQAAQDAAKEAGSQGSAPAGAQSAAKAGKASTAWKVPVWEAGFDLAPALGSAYAQASAHMNMVLSQDDLYVDLSVNVDSVPQGSEVIGTVRDTTNGQAVRTYSGLDILRLYTHNVRSKGVVVDGAL